MTVDALASSLEQLRLQADGLDSTFIDDLIEKENEAVDSVHSRKRARQSADDLKAELESEFLTPSPRFSPEWLNRLQK
jgi:antiviral helicase SKI2